MHGPRYALCGDLPVANLRVAISACISWHELLRWPQHMKASGAFSTVLLITSLLFSGGVKSSVSCGRWIDPRRE